MKNKKTNPTNRKGFSAPESLVLLVCIIAMGVPLYFVLKNFRDYTEETAPYREAKTEKLRKNLLDNATNKATQPSDTLSGIIEEIESKYLLAKKRTTQIQEMPLSNPSEEHSRNSMLMVSMTREQTLNEVITLLEASDTLSGIIEEIESKYLLAKKPTTQIQEMPLSNPSKEHNRNSMLMVSMLLIFLVLMGGGMRSTSKLF